MSGETWFSRGKREAEKDIPRADHVTGILLFIVSSFFLSYYITHQVRSTGFFTSSFETAEMILLYGSLVFWIMTSSLDSIFNRRLLSRLLDSCGGLIFSGISFAWLFFTFPFEFAYFTSVLPESLRFLLEWISNNVARILLGVGFLIHLVAAIYSPIAYKFIVIRHPRLKRNS